MLRYLIFAVWEAAISLWRSRVLNLLAVGTIMFAMFILGSFVLVGINLQKITVNWRDQIQFNVFLADDIDQSQIEAVRGTIEGSMLVKSAQFISKHRALELFGQDFPTYQTTVNALEKNPFPASFQVSLIRGTERAQFDELRVVILSREGVEEVYYDEEIFKRLDFFIRLIRLAGWFFGSIMVTSSIFSISNVLKLTFFTRREEVDIMKLVGASRAYIRGPFIVEGILIGLLGSLLGVSLVYLGHLLLQTYVADAEPFLMASLEPVFLPMSWVFILVLAGSLSGFLGSLFSLHQFLEEHISYQ
ncbi:MAG: ABC transporter permease [Acidobacteriota bacterium]|nr:ABC transporter permease [Acidobacteriota bacterium]